MVERLPLDILHDVERRFVISTAATKAQPGGDHQHRHLRQPRDRARLFTGSSVQPLQESRDISRAGDAGSWAGSGSEMASSMIRAFKNRYISGVARGAGWRRFHHTWSCNRGLWWSMNART